MYSVIYLGVFTFTNMGFDTIFITYILWLKDRYIYIFIYNPDGLKMDLN